VNGALKVLVLGAGGREHALARALARSPSVSEVIVAPGNGGTTAPSIRSVPSKLDPASVVALAKQEGVGLVVVGPEGPLCAGVVDALEAVGIPAYGPKKDAAELEGSKAFLKAFATRHGIPTAPYVIVRSFSDAEAAIRARGAPIVVKADGLCAGKGVVVATTIDEALAAARSMLEEGVFGDAGKTVILEDVIRGEEVSVHAVTDGERFLVLPPARDHKRVGTGDKGPNTGGMGAYAPSPRVTPELLVRIEREIIEPTIAGMRADRRPFRGTLFAGLMITPEGQPFLLEHNVRFGDPECEALMALLDGDVATLLATAARGKLETSSVRVASDRHALVLVLAAQGYPAAPRTGDAIRGLELAGGPETVVHHAGTAKQGDGVVTAGGRVLAITSTGRTLSEARSRAYAAARLIVFDGAHYRTDIGSEVGAET
jgi:phosphoribosylamine--glycine ligase